MKSPGRVSPSNALETDLWGECGRSGKDLLRQGHEAKREDMVGSITRALYC